MKYRATIISLLTTLLATVANSPAKSQDATPKKYSVGPAIEINSKGAAFGIEGKIRVAPRFTIRPIFLFGYQDPSPYGTVNLSTGSGGIFADLQKQQLDNFAAQLAISDLSNNRNCSGVCVAPTPPSSSSSSSSSSPRNVKRPAASGTAYGFAITYDLIAPQNKLSAYVGPRILFASTSGSLSGISLNTNLTNIDLLVGADYAISSNFTAGINATYNLSRSGLYTYKDEAGSIFTSSDVNGNKFAFGINFGYSF